MPTVKLSLQQSGPTAMQLENDVKVIIDRPEAQGGGGTGLMGGQYLLTGIAGCFCSTLFAAADARKINIEGLVVVVSAELDPEPPKHFSAISLDVSFTDCSAPDQFPTLLKIAEKGCISVNTVKQGMTFSIKD